jgi:hypothetical protein
MRRVAVTAFLALPWALDAQIAAPPRFEAGVYAGGSFPLGAARDSANAGYHVGGMGSTAVNGVLDVRVDFAFNKLGDKILSEGATFREVGTNLLSGTASAVIHRRGTPGDARGRRAISPYLVAGGGAYRFRFDYVCRGLACTGPERSGRSETRWGFNAGAGATVPLRGIGTFFQVSYHAILPKGGGNSSTTLFLTSFGLKVPVSRR